MSVFSEEDRKARRKAKAESTATDNMFRRRAPGVAAKLVKLLEDSAREMFRRGDDVTKIEVRDGSLYPESESSPYIPEAILSEAITTLVVARFGRDKSSFKLHVRHDDDTAKPAIDLHAENYRTQNEICVVFDKPLQ